jgi:hypothetical protein
MESPVRGVVYEVKQNNRRQAPRKEGQPGFVKDPKAAARNGHGNRNGARPDQNRRKNAGDCEQHRMASPAAFRGKRELTFRLQRLPYGDGEKNDDE